jgi:uncharacterized membrane-anchored protein YhcB (DUF1043 family)
MRILPVAALSLVVGAIVGYLGFPLLNRSVVEIEHAACDVPAITRDVVACTLSPEQIDHLSAQIAPAVVARLAATGLKSIEPDMKLAAQQRDADEKSKREQAAAFSEAARIVDQMITNHEITLRGRSQAQELLRQTGQADRIYEIEARISAAINRGDITPAQAGLGLPPTP